MSDPVTGNIRFSSYCLPPLAPRTYKVEVHQNVTELHGSASEQIAQPVSPFTPIHFEFDVSAPRFALNPGDIYSVYPPEGSTGDYEHSLPHIVFTRRTIPWERRRAADSPAGQPWMALLLLNDDNAGGGNSSIPKIEPRRVRDLFESLPSGVAGPRIGNLSDYERNDPCNTVDIDAEQFRQVAPSPADLAYLAHVREVDTDHKETASFLTDGSFSVVIGNRFPKANRGEHSVENRAILVSLEGMDDFLPGKQLPASVKTLRLAVLASWAFRSNKARDFKKHMHDLGQTLPLRLELPQDDGTEAAKYVRAAFSRGYAALNHNTRLGEQTVSWYRGPLTPLSIDSAARYDFKAVPDAAIGYDPANGLMDLTYAGAAQLGRLLGLQDRSFAQALSEWREAVQTQIKERLEREELRRVLRSQPDDERDELSPETKFLEMALLDAMTKDAAGERPRNTVDNALLAKAKPKIPNADDSGKPWRTATMDELPLSVHSWLARRVLLYGVPFLYLVPDERMLPLPSSLRFFRIDPLWIKRLIEGACSVGRNSAEAELVDSILGDEFFDLAVTGSAMVRSHPSSNGNRSSGNATPTFPLEGFLLRSPIVKDWQGLEMEAWRWDQGKKVAAPPLRIDRLAPNIMLCIFNGPLATIEIRQPPEGLHFGADGLRKASLRSVMATNPGRKIDIKDKTGIKQVDMPFRGDKNLQVLDVMKLAQHLHTALTQSNGMDQDAPFTMFTSAEFAVQMTESPGRVEIEVSKKP